MSASATGTKERKAREQRARGNGKNGAIKTMEEIGLGGLLPGTPIEAGRKKKSEPEPEAPKKGKGKGKPAPEPEPEAPKRIRKPKPEPEAPPAESPPAETPAAPEVNPAPSVPEPAQDAPSGSPDGSPEQPAENPQGEPEGPPAGAREAPGAWGPPASVGSIISIEEGADEPVEMGPLTDEERERKARYEAGAGGGFQAAGLNLGLLRDERLYRDEYPTFAEYVREVWDKTHRAINYMIAGAREVERLRLAGVAPEDLPKSEYGVRVLTTVPEGEREAVLREANQAARANGKPRAGGAEIAQASEGKRRGRPPGSKNTTSGDEPREVSRARANGTIPEDGPVTVIEVGAGEPDEIESPEEIFDRAKYLDQFPIREHLGKDPLAIFDSSAMTYHWLSAQRLAFVEEYAHPAFEVERRALGQIGPYAARLRRALMTGDPSTWTLCETCSGAATVEILGTVKPCSDCHRNGFKIP